jgi:hypothetical protein
MGDWRGDLAVVDPAPANLRQAVIADGMVRSRVRPRIPLPLRCELLPHHGFGHGGAMEYQIAWVHAYDDDEGQTAINKALGEWVAGGWALHSHSVVQVESTGQSEYVPQGHPLFTHFFIYQR